jgi:IS1 family transposase
MNGSIHQVFEHHAARIQRIAGEEIPGSSVIVIRDAWPLFQIRIEDMHGTIRSKISRGYSIREMERFTDRRLRTAIRKLCSLSHSQ